jgi:hypothetical protein
VFETVLLPEARAVRDALNEEDRADVDRITHLLEINPWADDATKFTAAIGQRTVGVYDDGRWEMVYRIVDDRFIKVLGITRIKG